MSAVKFIKIFDEQIAKTLESGGFSFMTEKINDNQTVYVFEESQEIHDALASLMGDGNYQELIFAVDDMLNF